jgi:predicted DCC family thiol-disulfide oxidoreductase YuxK
MKNVDALILFDGECGLCSRLVDFLLARDRKGRFRFAPQQSKAGGEVLAKCAADEENTDTIVLMENGRCFFRSAAVLRILRKLPGPWPVLYLFIAVPRPIRDLVYRWIARRRHRWFGRREVCASPGEKYKDRFLE